MCCGFELIMISYLCFGSSKHKLSKQKLETVADTNAVDMEVKDEK